MQIELLTPTAPFASCKVCNQKAPLYGVVDFNKNCEEPNGLWLSVAGIPIYYHRCEQCGLVFTVAFDQWEKQHYQRYIYNDDYITVDPEYLEIRPRNFAGMMYNFLEARTDLKLLDYGGGNGAMAGILREKGIDCQSWDTMDENTPYPQRQMFDIVTSFEVFEHTPTPLATAEEALSFLKPETGLLLFSTFTIDALPPRSISHPYIAPRNGHVTIYTQKSLSILFGKFGYKLHHFNVGTHLAYKTLPQLPPARK